MGGRRGGGAEKSREKNEEREDEEKEKKKRRRIRGRMKKRMTEKRPKKLKLLAVLFFILISGLIFTSIGSQIKFFPQPSPIPVAPPDAVNSPFSMMTALSQSQNYSASRISFVFENLPQGLSSASTALSSKKKRRILPTRNPDILKSKQEVSPWSKNPKH